LRFDFTRLAPESGGLRIIGNLPYNISTPLLFHLLKFSSLIVDMHFLLQKEVVERITAVPGSGDYGRLSVMVQSLAHAERLFNVGPGCFSPPPKVNSTFIRLTPHQKQMFSINDRGQFSQVVTQAFSKRRKTLRNALKELLSAAEISAENIDPGARAETLSIEQFAALSNRLSS
ncbi:MAG: ribosomal RNA small subunit methyltransferase A, partial [Gammaproteobacteria bacterium]|nr:ribosomal RNA small subunit methyltransferase A [Gammaproteobacteria bacterium]